MKNYFDIVKNYLQDLEIRVTYENRQQGIIIINNEAEGVVNLIICIAPPIIIFEQFIFEMEKPDLAIYKALLSKNRDMIHGAFTLDDSGTKVIYRNSLQVENIDSNELEGTLNALSLLLSEYSNQIINFSKKQ
ncbi:YbjN domain-containing protein [Polluticaenibacter yanchengensis]|uniref:YbjN domain-containing protein n=1 Tax=Polluticaenibacter yanchengensis TaxID=3014562 RepID=A0ABT4UPV0_9BACT|nr:YbjN domain-containing protein [Chitinophagaceae bacterium LY-5]